MKAKPIQNIFVRKLDNYAILSPEHRRDIEELTSDPHRLQTREIIVQDGDRPRAVDVVLSGWACRYKVLPDGRRQILALVLPGDMCDPYVFLFGTMRQTLATLTPVSLARLSTVAIRAMTASGPDLAEMLWWQAMIALEIQREWTINLGRRTGQERLAHLFCELSSRLRAVGLSDGLDCDIPLTQGDLADITGLSAVHVNRSLQSLRASGLVEMRSKRLTIHDLQGLMELAMFDPSYLHHGRI